jgi:hypothetical protein
LNPTPARSLLACLAQVPDRRGLQGRRHSLSATLAAVVCAVLCGARGYAAIAQWLHLQDVSVWHWLGFTRKPPGKCGIRKILLATCAEDFERAIRNWMGDSLPLAQSAESLQAVSFDGKRLCGTLTRHQRAFHLLAAVDQQSGCVLSQTQVDQKTNEAKTALELLKTIVLKGRVIVGDAIFCQRDVCEEVLEDGGHYLFVVKENQPTLLREIESAFAETKAFSPLRPAGIPRGTGDGRNVGQRPWSARVSAIGQHDGRQRLS